VNVLAVVAGLLLPSPLDEARRVTRPNPYVPTLSTQMNVAVGQNVRAGIRGGLSGRSGSEADYQLEQSTGRAAIGSLEQWVPGRSLPPSTFTPRLPDEPAGRGTGPQTGAYNKGFVILRDERRRWGGSARTIHRAQNVINGTMLGPRDRTPTARALGAAYVAANPDRLRLEDQY
jgi:hypothetical protein